MRDQNFGIEIEMTGLTRVNAAKVLAGYFGTDATHVGGVYDAYTVRDGDGRQWKIMSDASIHCQNRNGHNASRLNMLTTSSLQFQRLKMLWEHRIHLLSTRNFLNLM